MAVARYQTKRNAPMTAPIAQTTVLPVALQDQTPVARTTRGATAAVTRRVTARAAAGPNPAQIVKEIVSALYFTTGTYKLHSLLIRKCT